MVHGPTNKMQREAFIRGPKTAERVQRLNDAVFERSIIPVIGASGTGKDRFLDWWWQQGCADATYAGNNIVSTDDIILVRVRAARSTTIPVAGFLMNGLWHALLELRRARENGDRIRPVAHLRALKTESQLVSLIDDAIMPLLDELDPVAIAVLDTHVLDETALNWLLDLRMPVQRGRPLVAKRALILCGTEDVTAQSRGPIAKMMDKTEVLRRAWFERLVFQRMDADVESDEFERIMTKLLRQNLNAIFGEGTDAGGYLDEYAAWTTTNWYLIEELVRVLDTCLGPARNDEPRVITEAVMTCVRQTWLKRTH